MYGRLPHETVVAVDVILSHEVVDDLLRHWSHSLQIIFQSLQLCRQPIHIHCSILRFTLEQSTMCEIGSEMRGLHNLR